MNAESESKSVYNITFFDYVCYEVETCEPWKFILGSFGREFIESAKFINLEIFTIEWKLFYYVLFFKPVNIWLIYELALPSSS